MRGEGIQGTWMILDLFTAQHMLMETYHLHNVIKNQQQVANCSLSGITGSQKYLVLKQLNSFFIYQVVCVDVKNYLGHLKGS